MIYIFCHHISSSTAIFDPEQPKTMYAALPSTNHVLFLQAAKPAGQWIDFSVIGDDRGITG